MRDGRLPGRRLAVRGEDRQRGPEAGAAARQVEVCRCDPLRLLPPVRWLQHRSSRSPGPAPAAWQRLECRLHQSEARAPREVVVEPGALRAAYEVAELDSSSWSIKIFVSHGW